VNDLLALLNALMTSVTAERKRPGFPGADDAVADVRNLRDRAIVLRSKTEKAAWNGGFFLF
jgi:hypothetical protein